MATSDLIANFILNAIEDSAGGFAELQGVFPVAPEVHGGCDQAEYGAQQQRVQHIRHRQVLEQQHHGEDAAE